MKKILITGCLGFIGSNLVRHWINSEKYDVCGVDDESIGVRSNLPYNFNRFFYGNLKDKKTCDVLTENIDVVIHLAAQSGVQPSIKDPIGTFENNVSSTVNLLTSCVKNNIKKFIFASSGGTILGNQKPPANEKSLMKPISPYGASKASSEHYCNVFHKTYKLNTTILRFSNIYGHYSLHKRCNLLPTLFNCVLNNEIFYINGDGTQTRDFLYIDDLMDLMEIVIENDVMTYGETYQLGTEKETSINEIVEIFQKEIKKYGVNFKYENGDPLNGDVLRNYSDISKVKRELNWTPKINIEQGIKKFIEINMREYNND